MNKLLGVFIGIIGVGLIAVGLPVYDMMVGQAWIQGGLFSMVLFWSLLLATGFVLLLFAVYVWRKQ